MIRVRSLWLRVSRDWPRWAQVAGFLLGSEQVVAWWVAGREPNVGAMTFAGALLMFQRIADAQRKRDER
jgi:glucose-6-phosphate dehydrogenase assembly protein OpcA